MRSEEQHESNSKAFFVPIFKKNFACRTNQNEN